MTSYHVPTATYRVQLHREWGFDAARRIVEYLNVLGIGDLYVSPIFASRSGSAHGYDVVDPSSISAELGGAEKLRALAQDLNERGMGVVLDIVPNHMAIGPENPAWMDVLAHGHASKYEKWFDIEWPRGDDGAITVPVLGRSLDQAIEVGELSLDVADGMCVIRYSDGVFPLEARSWARILERAARLADAAGSGAARGLADVAAIAEQVPDWRNAEQDSVERRRERVEALRERFRAAAEDAGLMRYIVEAMANTPLREVLNEQPYRLCYWREATRRAAYRRFFDITHLIGVRVEDTEVFRETHATILRLVNEGSVIGLRVDHVDGLADPLQYLRRLAVFCRESGPYVVVEKILGCRESLDDEWPVAGTTGYDFINAMNGLFVDIGGLEALAQHQATLLGRSNDLETVMYEQKKRVATELFGGEVKALVQRLDAIGRRLGTVLPETALFMAMVEVSSCLDVYRTYITRDHVRNGTIKKRDRRVIVRALSRTGARGEDDCRAALAFLERVLLLELPRDVLADAADDIADIIVKWQQFTGPLAAKGVEDTALYCDARLVSLNEVGADAEDIERPRGVPGFHRHNSEVAARWPHTMTATSTHDTKRSEDARARIYVLSEIAAEWAAAVDHWRRVNGHLRRSVEGEEAPDALTELFLYQNLVGIWTLANEDLDDLAARMIEFAIKAAREAKRHTTWIEPASQYEEALGQFVRGILDPRQSIEFLEGFKRLVDRIAFAGACNSLSAVLLKICSPGVPDFYQGSDLWALSLVDPDNRRPIDYEVRRNHLAAVAAMPEAPAEPELAELLHSWPSGRIKMFVTYRGLRLRRTMRDVFLDGTYTPLKVHGTRARHVCAFARQHKGLWAIAVAPILMGNVTCEGRPALGESVWSDTAVELPHDASRYLRNAMSGRGLDVDGRRLVVADALRHLPVALLHT